MCPEVFLVYITDFSLLAVSQSWWWRLLGSLPTGTPDSRLEPGQSNVSLTTPGPGFLWCGASTLPARAGVDWSRHGTGDLNSLTH